MVGWAYLPGRNNRLGCSSQKEKPGGKDLPKLLPLPSLLHLFLINKKSRVWEPYKKFHRRRPWRRRAKPCCTSCKLPVFRQDVDSLPRPEVLVAEIVKNWQAALEQFTAVVEKLGKGRRPSRSELGERGCRRPACTVESAKPEASECVGLGV